MVEEDQCASLLCKLFYLIQSSVTPRKSKILPSTLVLFLLYFKILLHFLCVLCVSIHVHIHMIPHSPYKDNEFLGATITGGCEPCVVCDGS